MRPGQVWEQGRDMQVELKNPWMMSLSRTGLLRFISHLDWLAMVERIFTRAELPVVYSEGYHPRPIIKASPPLPTGVASLCELLQIFFFAQQDPKDAARKLADALPEGVGLNWVQPMRFKPPKNPYKAIAAAEYSYDFREPLRADRKERLLSALMTLLCDSVRENASAFGPDMITMKPITGKLIEIKEQEKFLEGESNQVRLVGKMDSMETLHAAKLGLFLYEIVPLGRYPLITKLTHLRQTPKGYEPVFAR